MTYSYAEISHWYMPKSAFQSTVKSLARHGREGREGIVFWLGKRHESQADILHIVTIPSSKMEHTSLFLDVPPETLNLVTDISSRYGVAIVGQAHSHPSGYPVDLSITDRTHGFNIPYFLSVVVPDFGQKPGTKIWDCGIHVYYPGRGYERLSKRTARKMLEFKDSDEFSVLELGETLL